MAALGLLVEGFGQPPFALGRSSIVELGRSGSCFILSVSSPIWMHLQCGWLNYGLHDLIMPWWILVTPLEEFGYAKVSPHTKILHCP